MSITLVFWILMLFWFLFGIAQWRGMVGAYGVWGHSLLLFILLLLLGWATFGAPVKGM